jgi:hypothetical protein
MEEDRKAKLNRSARIQFRRIAELSISLVYQMDCKYYQTKV